MRHRFHRIMTMLGIIGCAALTVPACTFTASGSAKIRPVYIVDSEPPPPRVEQQQPRPGQVWMRGHWQRRGHDWVWISGHWENTRQGQQWQPGHWEKRGAQWHWIEGRWVAAGAVDAQPPVVGNYPTQPPPRPTYERPATRAGFIWVQGHYEWKNGKYHWVKGHWERLRKGYEWRAGRWEAQNGRWVWIPGEWVVVATGPTGTGTGGTGGIVPWPTQPPPKPNYERPAPRAGFVWVQGHFEWKNGKYHWVKGHWERARKGYEWRAGRWEAQNGRWVWTPGEWVVVAVDASGQVVDGPTQPPPRPTYEKPAPRAGFIWVQGHYEWKNGKYHWVKGHWERARKRQTWQAGRWELRGKVYVWTPGRWGKVK